MRDHRWLPRAVAFGSWLLTTLWAVGALAGPTITITGEYHDQKKLQNLKPNTTVECKNAKFYLHLADKDTSNNYILQVRSSVDTVVQNVSIIGDVPLNNYWNDQYKNNNSAAFSFMESHGGTLQNAKITRAWDALRAARDTKGTYVFRKVWVEKWRDDAIETDTGYPNTLIEDSLFDGGYTGFSSRQGANSGAGDASSRWLKLHKVLLRLTPYLGNKAKYGSTPTHNCPMKLSSNCQSIEVIDNVWAFEVSTAGCWGTNWKTTFKNKLKVSKNNLLLWLGKGPFPSKVWVPPGFKTMSGQQARDEWDKRRAAWVKAFTGGTPTPEPQPEPFDATSLGVVLDGGIGAPAADGGVAPPPSTDDPPNELADPADPDDAEPMAVGGCSQSGRARAASLPLISALLALLAMLVLRRAG